MQQHARSQAARERHSQDSNPASHVRSPTLVSPQILWERYVPGTGSEHWSLTPASTETTGRVLSPSGPQVPQLWNKPRGPSLSSCWGVERRSPEVKKSCWDSVWPCMVACPCSPLSLNFPIWHSPFHRVVVRLG